MQPAPSARSASPDRIGFEGPGRGEAVHVRHLDVHQDDGRSLLARRANPGGAVGGLDQRALDALEHGADDLPVDLRVVDVEDAQARRAEARHLPHEPAV